MRKLATLILVVALGGCGRGVATAPAVNPTAPSAPPVAVATASPRPTPTPVLAAPCPDVDSPSLFEFVEADPACFPGDVLLTGWLGRPPPMGFEGPRVEPAWLYYPADDFAVLWSVKPGGGDDQHCPDPRPEPCAWIFLHVDPSSGIELGAAQRWIQVVGHLHDPASATCHYTYPDDPDENPYGSPPDAETQAQCDTNFVVTRVGEVADG
jgi:hypothetical protein